AGGSTVAREFQRRVAAVDDALEDLDDESDGITPRRRASEEPRGEFRTRQRRLDEPRMSRHVEEFDADDDLPPRANGRASEEPWTKIRARQRRLDEARMSRRHVEEFDEHDDVRPRANGHASEEPRAEIRARQRRLNEARVSRREFDERDEVPPRATLDTTNL